jgi:class 3 adenylate cyclase/tetratricopeptide (TPR) repeat protein
MRCPRCKAENPGSAKFCSDCGARLEAPCSSCGHTNAPGARFCNECGQSLDQPPTPLYRPAAESMPAYTPKHLAERVLSYRSALEGERKQVTVLFVDIVESSRLAERLDPEIMHRLMDRTLRLMAETVHRYEGTVNQFLGDGLMALFGAPLALEDHASRAVQAALAIRETVDGYSEQLKQELGVEIRLRLGLNSGLVVVGRIGDDLRMDYTAVGDTTNLAARMQALAEPGTILMTDATHRLVSAHVRWESLGSVLVKGRSAPVPAFKVIGRQRRRSRLEIGADLGLTGLVGRQRELAVLRDGFARVKAGRGHVVGIVGEPGVGKSRLLYEFRKSLEGEHVTWLESHCAPYGQAMPYLPLLEMCKANFNIEDDDNPLQVDQKLRQGLRQVDPDLMGILPFLRELLGAAGLDDTLRHLDPKDKRQRTFEALRRLVFRGSPDRPLVFIFEDLHWIDRTSEDYLAFAIESLSAVPALLLTTCRPGYAARWSDKTYYTQVALDLLGEREVEAMLERMFGLPTVPPELARVVWEKAEGNPLFVEEIVRSLRENGLGEVRDGALVWRKDREIQFSGTVQDIIRARLDRLDDPVKRTAQTASVIGRGFALAVLTRIAERPEEVPHDLDALKRLELVHETRLYPELEYGFTHGVIQDVAYQTLLLQRRRDLHGAIGRAIEDLYADRLDEQASILAYHYARSEHHDRAVAYALRAGDRAARLYANAEATTYYEQALAMARGRGAMPDGHPAVIDATVKLAAVGVTRQDIIERDRLNLEAARALAEDLRDEPRLAQVLYWLGRIAYVLWQPSTAITYAQRSLDIAERLGDEALAAPPVNLMGRIYWQKSEYLQASQLLARSAAQMRRLGNKTEESTAAGFAAFALGLMGEFDRALAYADHGLQLAEEIKNPFAEAPLFLNRAIVRGERGEWQLAFIDFETARRIAEEVGDLFRVYVVKCFEGRVRTMAGQQHLGRTLIEESLALAEQIGSRFIRAWQKSFLADALLALGELDAVPALCEEAIQLADEMGDRFPTACASRTLAETLLRTNPTQRFEAEERMEAALRVLQEIGTRPELARSYVSYARSLLGAGERDRAIELLAQATAMFQEMGMTGHVAEIDALRDS